MKYFYRGNLNLPENRRVKNGCEYYVRGYVQIGDEYYERYAVKTDIIGLNENIAELVQKYVMPLYEGGDILAVTEKIVSLAEGRVLSYENKSASKIACLLSKYMTKTNVDKSAELKIQAMFDSIGFFKFLFASAISAIGKAIGQKGWFYRILGREARGMDGLYTGSFMPLYRRHAILVPINYQALINEVDEQTGCPAFVSDTNDIASNAYGLSPGVRLSKDTLEKILWDNPGGQNDELTPFIIIRKVSESEKEDCVLPQKISR